jgi:hypothetical protein
MSDRTPPALAKVTLADLDDLDWMQRLTDTARPPVADRLSRPQIAAER